MTSRPFRSDAEANQFARGASHDEVDVTTYKMAKAFHGSGWSDAECVREVIAITIEKLLAIDPLAGPVAIQDNLAAAVNDLVIVGIAARSL